MKVLLIYSDIGGAEHYGAHKYYSGLGSISAVLKQAGHETELLYLGRELAREEFVAAVESARPDLVGFSCTTHQYRYVARYAGYLQQSMPELLRLCGGVHPTLVPEDVIADPVWDVVCVGEGEYPLRDLAERLASARDYLDVPNLWIRRNGEIVRNPMRPLIADLDALPYVDRELFGYDEMLAANDGWVDIVAGRGCPYSCSYCCNHALRERFRGLGRYVRFRSVAHVLGEIAAITARYTVKTINFQDDILTLDKDWTLAFCSGYGAAHDKPFWLNARVESLLDEDVVAALADADCAGVRIGVENGDETLRRSVLKRAMSNADIVRAAYLARRHGLKVYTCNMIGVPGETPETIRATIALNRELAPDGFQFSVFYPYPMTELHETCIAQGLIRPGAELSDYYGRQNALRLPTLTDAELAQGYDRFEALRAELALRRASPAKHRVYRALLALYGGDAPRLHCHLDALRGIRRGIWRLLGRPHRGKARP